MEANGNANTTFQNLWDAAKTVIRRKYVGHSSRHKKSLSQPNIPSKGAGKRTPNKPKTSRIIKIRAKINDEQFYANKLGNLEEMDTFLET